MPPFSVGLGMNQHNIQEEMLGSPWGALLGNGMTMGTVTAIALTAFIELTKPRSRRLEMDFMAVFEEENLEDRLACLDEQSETVDERELSFRLLRHYASSERHQKYHGLDIVTVQVTR